MLGISSYRAGYASNSYAKLSQIYSRMASGKRINSAADDAAGLAISQKLSTQTISNSTRNKNAADERNALNIRDASLSTTTSALQRMRQLGIQASNGIYGSQERKLLQSEVDQLKKFIGSDKLAELGLTDYSVESGDPDISAIDSAVKAVSSEQGSIGAQVNGLTSQINARAIADENLTASLSQIVDLDYGAMFNQLNTERSLFQMRMMMQKNHMNNMYGMVSRVFGF